MKKTTLLILLVAFSICSFAQVEILPLKALHFNDALKIKPSSKNTNSVKKLSKSVVTLFYDDFEVGDLANWDIYNTATITDNQWHTIGFGNPGLSAGVVYSQVESQDEKLVTKNNISLNPSSVYKLEFDFYSGFEYNVSPYNAADIMIEVSTNNGLTWSAPIWQEDDSAKVVNSGVIWPWSSGVWNTARVDLSPYSGQSVKIRFHYTGFDGDLFYFDNVHIFEMRDSDLALIGKKQNYLYGADGGYFSKIPVDEIKFLYDNDIPSYYFNAITFNNGVNYQTNAGINVKVNNGIADVYDVDFTIDTIFSSEGYQIVLDSGFVALPIIQSYNIIYNTFSDQIDEDPSDNSANLTFEVTDTVFARDLNANDTLELSVDGYFIGCQYFFMTDDTVSSISFFVQNGTDVGISVVGSIYDTTHALVVNTAPYVIQPSDIDSWVTIPFTTKTEVSGFVEPNPGVYYAGIEATTGGAKLNLAIELADYHEYANTSMLRDDLNNWNPVGFVPAVRLNVVQSFKPLSISDISMTRPSCFGDSTGMAVVTANDGVAPYTYTWSVSDSNPLTLDSLENIPAGDFYVTVTDNDGVSISSLFTINEPEDLSITPSSTKAYCGQNNGTASVVVTGGTLDYTYSWSQGGDAANISNLTDGDYKLTVTDANNCIDSITVSVLRTSNLSISVSGTDESVTDANDGTASVLVTGGTADYVYTWSNSETTQDITGLTAGTYTVTVTDSDDCTATKSITINTTTTTGINGVLKVSEIAVYPNPTKGLLYIANANNANVYVYNMIGELVITKSVISNSIDLRSLESGYYLVKVVTDNKSITKKVSLMK